MNTDMEAFRPLTLSVSACDHPMSRRCERYATDCPFAPPTTRSAEERSRSGTAIDLRKPLENPPPLLVEDRRITEHYLTIYIRRLVLRRCYPYLRAEATGEAYQQNG
jgi:hypothetical protein